MNDVGPLVRPPLPTFEEANSEVHQWLADRRALIVRINRISLALNAGLLVLGIALAGAICVMVPLQRIQTRIVAFNSDGTHTVLNHYYELDPPARQRALINTLWQYVFYRERYTYDGAPSDYALVSALSDQHTRDEYQQWFRDSPDSPQQRLGDTGSILVEYIPYGVRIINDQSADVTFFATEFNRGSEPDRSKRQRYTARVGYKMLDEISESSAGFNDAGLEVTSYQRICDSCAGG